MKTSIVTKEKVEATQAEIVSQIKALVKLYKNTVIVDDDSEILTEKLGYDAETVDLFELHTDHELLCLNLVAQYHTVQVDEEDPYYVYIKDWNDEQHLSKAWLCNSCQTYLTEPENWEWY